MLTKDCFNSVGMTKNTSMNSIGHKLLLPAIALTPLISMAQSTLMTYMAPDRRPSSELPKPNHRYIA
ncbi:MAG: hypothetical protein K2F63_00825, partial [Muribaculaceae bacterium]|nr:hypothetical protein [Muribaculaceae bacterium]